MKKVTTLAIIPSRGGSKGIPRKGLAKVAGKTLIERAVTAAKNSCLDKIICSTDDHEFAEEAKKFGAEVPFLRPDELATDSASVIDTIDHLLDNIDFYPEYLLLFQPTSPFVTSEDIDNSFKLLEEADAVIGVCESEVKPDWLRRVGKNGTLKTIGSLDTEKHRPRQEMPVTYRINGSLYWIKTALFQQIKTFQPFNTKPYIMPQERSIDIDTPLDLDLANWMMERVS